MTCLTLPEAREIKARLWHGETVAALSTTFGVTAGMIRHIRNGLHWADVPWPASDPKTKEPLTGAMPLDRLRKIEMERRAAIAELQEAAREELQRTLKRRLRRA